MREIGGYIELDRYDMPMLHNGAVALNCGRSCLAYLIQAKKIKKIIIPYFLCNSVKDLCKKEKVEVGYYHINENFLPVNIKCEPDEWVYIVNYYGQLTAEQIKAFKEQYKHIIVDNAQAYFQPPVDKVDTLYTCRKYFGVADGAFLYTDKLLDEEPPVDESFERMHFLLGRFERTASEFYSEYAENNRLFADEPIKKMSKLTNNLLHAVNYEKIKNKRTENFKLYFEKFKDINQLNLYHTEGAFAYPLLLKNGAEIRRVLQKQKIYIPTLWPNVMEEVDKSAVEYNFAENILPLPCDQRYDKDDIHYVIKELIKCIC